VEDANINSKVKIKNALTALCSSEQMVLTFYFEGEFHFEFLI